MKVGFQQEVPTKRWPFFIPSPFCQSSVGLEVLHTCSLRKESQVHSRPQFPGTADQPSLSAPQQVGLRGPAGLQTSPRSTLINVSPRAEGKYLEETAGQAWDGHLLPPLGSSLFENSSPRLGLWAEAQVGKGRKEAAPWTSL